MQGGGGRGMATVRVVEKKRDGVFEGAQKSWKIPDLDYYRVGTVRNIVATFRTC